MTFFFHSGSTSLSPSVSSLWSSSLGRANAMVLDKTAPSEDDHNELTDGLKEVEPEWKKKVIYD